MPNQTLTTVTSPPAGAPIRPERDMARVNRRRRDPATPLLGLLLALDLNAVMISWTAAWVFFGPRGDSSWQICLQVAAAVAVALFLARAEGLYRPGVGSVRTIEVAGVMRVATRGAAVALAVPVVAGTDPALDVIITGSFLSFATVSLGRGLYGAWLRGERTRGNLVEPVVVVGYGEEADRLVNLIANHPELGMQICGLACDGETAAAHDLPWLGHPGLAVDAILRSGATSAIVSTAGMSPKEHNRVIHQLVQGGMHVQLSSGLQKVCHERLRRVALANEPFFAVEGNGPTRLQLALKRIMDVAVASTVLVLTAPLLAVTALAVKLCDRGPILFRQTRVGQFGREFTVLKFRTMVVDAEAKLAELAADNERRGPLFKVTADPRVTKVGRFLRASSLDELPQLFNVLAGSMSLVGPRPALPSEVAEFDEELLRRHDVPPGITGLWQVDCRDNSSFDAYRHLDLFYVENWSVALDLLLLWATVPSVLIRGLGSVLGRRTEAAPRRLPTDHGQAGAARDLVAS